MPKKHKFRAKATELDGIRFPSKLEASYFNQLKIAQKSGELLFFLRQVPFDLPGGITYRLDFIEFWAPKDNQPGDIIFTEVKGLMTDVARIKIKQCEELYNININIVTK